MTAPRASIVVPAHDEQAVILRCLAPFRAAVAAGDVEIVVVCNACTDRTAELARQVPGVTVVEIPVASKVAALREGERHVTAFPRAYLDADVELSPAGLFHVVDRLDRGPWLAGRPPLRYAAETSTWPVRLFYRARSRMPSVLNRLWGAGVYVLSRAGRARFDVFPDVTADDVYVDSLFAAAEIVVSGDPPVVVRVPATLPTLVRVLARVQRGKHDRAPGHGPAVNPPNPALRDLALSVRSPIDLAAASTYAVLVLFARIRVAASPRPATWERDVTSR